MIAVVNAEPAVRDMEDRSIADQTRFIEQTGVGRDPVSIGGLIEARYTVPE